MPIPATPFIWFNGKLVPWEKATVHVLAHALHYGSSVFEGVRAYETPRGPAIFRLKDHTRRLFESAHILQMKLPFTEAADFSGIAAEPLKIGQVEHVADIDVDEEGTEAAATTGVEIVATSAPAPPIDSVTFNANRPFLFFVRDDKSGAILFAGRLADPSTVAPG